MAILPFDVKTMVAKNLSRSLAVLHYVSSIFTWETRLRSNDILVEYCGIKAKGSYQSKPWMFKIRSSSSRKLNYIAFVRSFLYLFKSFLYDLPQQHGQVIFSALLWCRLEFVLPQKFRLVFGSILRCCLSKQNVISPLLYRCRLH